MTRRISLFSAVLVIVLIVPNTSVAQAQNPVDLTIFRDVDSLTIFVPGTQPVSLQGFRFEFATSAGQRDSKRLEDFPSFQGLYFDRIQPPICFRLERFNSHSPVPDACPPSQTLVQLRNDADVFWYDGVTHQDRLLLIFNGADQMGMCAAGQSECSVTYISSLTPPQLALKGVARNADWTPYSETFDEVQMVLAPAGCFMMGGQYGGNDDQPAHRVCFDKPFWIDRTEVTNAQYGSSGTFSGDDRPRETVTWTEARDFCVSRGARLPTEAEWEYVARGPNAWVFPWGNEFDGSRAIWNRSDSEGTAQVGSKPEGASWVGALDMSGNVWEWVADWYDAAYYATLQDGVVNPSGPKSGNERVVRGGSWYDEQANGLIAFSRGRSAGVPDAGTGFRCARSY